MRNVREQHRAGTLRASCSSALWLAQAIEKDLLCAKGSIVNISSVMAVKPQSNHFLYPSMKAALETLTTQREQPAPWDSAQAVLRWLKQHRVALKR